MATPHRTYVVLGLLMLGSVTLGTAIAYPSPAGDGIQDDFDFSDDSVGVFGALTSITAIFGPVVTNAAMKHGGRKLTCQVLSLISIASWVILVCSRKETVRWGPMIYRAVIGIAAGGFSSVIPTFILEIAPPESQGLFGTMHQLGITIGILFVNLFGILLSWRALALSMCIFPGLLLVTAPMLENNLPVGAGKIKFRELLNRNYASELMVSFLLMLIQQLSGVNAVLSNLGQIAGTSLGATLASSAQVVAVIVCAVLIERIGRKVAWIVSCAGATLCMIALSINEGRPMPAGWAPFAAFGYLFFFCFGLGPIPWFLIPEMFPEALRTTAGALFSGVNWFFSFLVVLLYPMVASRLGSCQIMRAFVAVLFGGCVFGVYGLGGRSQPKEREALGDTERLHGVSFDNEVELSDD